MKELDRNDPDAIVGRSRELAEKRWPDIKGQLDNAKEIPVAEIASCTPLGRDTSFDGSSPR